MVGPPKCTTESPTTQLPSSDTGSQACSSVSTPRPRQQEQTLVDPQAPERDQLQGVQKQLETQFCQQQAQEAEEAVVVTQQDLQEQQLRAQMEQARQKSTLSPRSLQWQYEVVQQAECQMQHTEQKLQTVLNSLKENAQLRDEVQAMGDCVNENARLKEEVQAMNICKTENARLKAEVQAMSAHIKENAQLKEQVQVMTGCNARLNEEVQAMNRCAQENARLTREMQALSGCMKENTRLKEEMRTMNSCKKENLQLKEELHAQRLLIRDLEGQLIHEKSASKVVAPGEAERILTNKLQAENVALHAEVCTMRNQLLEM